jgi:hypothetical protein
MNERIKELAVEAGLKQRIWNSLGKELPMWQEDPNNPGLEKFAELLVKECAMIVEGFTFEWEVAEDQYQEYEASDILKKHFGVEL